MKAILDNKKYYEIKSEKGDFYICENNGKTKMFAKKDVQVVEVNAIPKAKKYKQNWSKVQDIHDVTLDWKDQVAYADMAERKFMHQYPSIKSTK
jgi:hypothetical protein